MKIFLLMFSLLSLQAYGHGEHKPGPHGGYIQMPGTFHIELVPSGDSFKVYLLDINWKNPTIKNSSVIFTYKADKVLGLSPCKASKNYFQCELDNQAVEFKKAGELEISATRDGVEGMLATYKLPLTRPHHH